MACAPHSLSHLDGCDEGFWKAGCIQAGEAQRVVVREVSHDRRGQRKQAAAELRRPLKDASQAVVHCCAVLFLWDKQLHDSSYGSPRAGSFRVAWLDKDWLIKLHTCGLAVLPGA